MTLSTKSENKASDLHTHEHKHIDSDTKLSFLKRLFLNIFIDLCGQ